MVTAYGREEVLTEAEGAGIENVLIKPVSASMLFDSVVACSAAHRPRPPARDLPERGRHRLAALRARASCWSRTTRSTSRWRASCWETPGFVVDVADNGQIALDMLQQGSYDLVFMDMQMPVMDGVTATREMRKLERFANLPIVAMTANAMEQDRRKCMEAGMNDYVVKPIDPQDMWACCCDGFARGAPAPRPRRPDSRAQAGPPRPAGGIARGHRGPGHEAGPEPHDGQEIAVPGDAAPVRGRPAGRGDGDPAALAAGDRATAERIAHTTKAVSGNIGATAGAGAGRGAGDWRSGGTVRRPVIEQLLDEVDTPLRELLAALARGWRPIPAGGRACMKAAAIHLAAR